MSTRFRVYASVGRTADLVELFRGDIILSPFNMSDPPSALSWPVVNLSTALKRTFCSILDTDSGLFNGLTAREDLGLRSTPEAAMYPVCSWVGGACPSRAQPVLLMSRTKWSTEFHFRRSGFKMYTVPRKIHLSGLFGVDGLTVTPGERDVMSTNILALERYHLQNHLALGHQGPPPRVPMLPRTTWEIFPFLEVLPYSPLDVP